MAHEASSDTSPADFAAWLAAARAGSQESLGRLLEDCRPYLRSIVASHLEGPNGPSDSWLDLVQETYFCAVHGFSGFRGTSPIELRSWLRRILVNVLAAHGLERAHRPTPLSPNQEKSDDDTPGRLAAEDERREQTQSAIAKLPADYREVLALRHRDAWTWEAIGEVAVNCTPNGVARQSRGPVMPRR
jgi:RNA polymerase sigma-70 factor, ECF subfamily